MISQPLIGIFFLFGALGACKPEENDMSEGLNSPDWHQRALAVRTLGNSQDHAGAVRALEPVLRHDPNRDVRVYAAIALGQLGGSDATALLVEQVVSTDQPVRLAAVTAIGTTRDPSTIPGLLNLFRLNRGEDDSVAQIEAHRALLKIGAPGVPQLRQALNDPSPQVHKAAVEVLGEMGIQR